MLRVKGIYDGSKVILLEPVSLPPNTAVEVLIAEMPDEAEREYWERLLALGLVTEIRHRPRVDTPFTPIPLRGIPISQTLLEERR